MNNKEFFEGKKTVEPESRADDFKNPLLEIKELDDVPKFIDRVLKNKGGGKKKVQLGMDEDLNVSDSTLCKHTKHANGIVILPDRDFQNYTVSFVRDFVEGDPRVIKREKVAAHDEDRRYFEMIDENYWRLA